MAHDPMDPVSLLHAAYYEAAKEAVDRLTAPSTGGDEVADILEEVAQGGDITHAVLFMLVMRLRGVADKIPSPMEMATMDTGGKLVLPPGVHVEIVGPG